MSQTLLFTRAFLNSQSSGRDIMVINNISNSIGSFPDYFPSRRKVVWA